MRKVIFYFSPCGGTKTVADIINKACGDVLMQEITTPSMDVSLDENTLAFFCFPVYGGRIPKPMYDRMEQIKGNKTPCVHVAVYGNRAVDDALLEMQDLSDKHGFITVGGCEIDINAQVLDTKGAVIPGLYANGEVANAQLLGMVYPQSGASLSFYLTYGRVAGQNAAAYALGK